MTYCYLKVRYAWPETAQPSALVFDNDKGESMHSMMSALQLSWLSVNHMCMDIVSLGAVFFHVEQDCVYRHKALQNLSR